MVDSTSQKPHIDVMPIVSNHGEEAETITFQINVHPSECKDQEMLYHYEVYGGKSTSLPRDGCISHLIVDAD